MWKKWSWTVFVLIGGMGVAMSLQMLFAPGAFGALMAKIGPPQPGALADPAAARVLAFMGRWVATSLLGLNAITVVVACTALRRRERWAAWAMLYWPAMFASHFLMYEHGPMRVVQVVWFVLSLAALAPVFAPGPVRAPATA